MLNDIRYAIRTLRQNPGFALVAIVSIALGIGATAAVFSLAEAIVLRPLAVRDPWGLVSLRSYVPGQQAVGILSGPLSYPDFVDFRARSKSYESLTAFEYGMWGFTADERKQPQAKLALAVTGNFFDVLGLRPQIGRGFLPEEDQVPGRDAVAVISHALWVSEFASNPEVIGKEFALNGIKFTVVGVAPERFTGADQATRPSLYVPMMMVPRLSGDARYNPLEDRGMRGVQPRGRLKRGVSVPQATAEAKGISAELAQAYPATNRNYSALVYSEFGLRIASDPYDAITFGFILLLSISVLLIACANVANLMLSRAWARTREFAVRLAVGAGRGRLIRQLLTESVMIAFLGGAAGIGLAEWAAAAMSPIIVPGFNFPVVFDINIDTQVLLYALAATFFSAVFFGLAPAFRATKTEVAPALKASPMDNGIRSRLLGRNALVISQVTASLVLSVVAAQAFRGARIALSSSAGFRKDHMLMTSFDPSMLRYSPAQTDQFYGKLLDSARRMAGVKAAALAETLPMSPPVGNLARVVTEGPAPLRASDAAATISIAVSDGYFEALEIPILKGRGFLETDKADSPHVAVINEVLARNRFQGQDPVGKHVRIGDAPGREVEIVGVAKESKAIFIVEPPVEVIYVPLKQNPLSHLVLMLASDGPSTALAAPLRDLVRLTDPDQPLIGMMTMEDFFEQRATKLIKMLNGLFGGLAFTGLAMAILGLYGLMTYSVTRRTREIGIRMAIGAGRVEVLAMVLKHGLILSGVGVATGLVISVLVSKALTTVIGVPPFSMALMVAVPLGMLAVAALGAYIPARRASLVDPNSILRQE